MFSSIVHAMSPMLLTSYAAKCLSWGCNSKINHDKFNTVSIKNKPNLLRPISQSDRYENFK